MADYTWIPFYEQMAGAIHGYNNNRRGLFNKIKGLAANNPLMGYLHFEKREMWSARGDEIDPFTVMGIYNRGVTDAHRKQLGLDLARTLGVDLEPPSVFHGIAHLDPRRSIYEGNAELWSLFDVSIKVNGWENGFSIAFDKAIQIHGNGLPSLSIGLFWMRPTRFMPLDGISLPYIASRYGLPAPDEKCSGDEYLQYMRKLESAMGETSFPAIAHAAWAAKHGG